MRHRSMTTNQLSNELQNRILRIRREYEFERTEETEADLTEILGPKIPSIQIISTPEFIQVLISYAIGQCRGVCPSLLMKEEQSRTEDLWPPLVEGHEPKIWVRQTRISVDPQSSSRYISIEADANALHHWSQSLLCPDSVEYTSKLVLFHPKRSNPFSATLDESFGHDLQCVFDICGFGLLADLSVKDFSIQSSVYSTTDWEASVRALKKSMQEFIESSEEQSGGTGTTTITSTDENLLRLFCIIWPNQGWAYCRSALLECTALMALEKDSIIIIPESYVLSTRDRKQKLIGLCFSLYSMFRKGIGAFRLAIPDDTEFKHHRQQQQEEMEEVPPVPIEKTIHLAFVQSNDSRWLNFAYCDPKGEVLSSSCRIIFNNARKKTNMKKLILECIHNLKFEGKERARKVKFYILLENLPEMILNLPDKPNYVLCFANLEKGLNWKKSSSDGKQTISVESETENLIRNQLSELAFLCMLREYPSIGAKKGVFLGAFDKNEAQKRSEPLHLRCARTLASYLNGVVPFSNDEDFSL